MCWNVQFSTPLNVTAFPEILQYYTICFFCAVNKSLLHFFVTTDLQQVAKKKKEKITSGERHKWKEAHVSAMRLERSPISKAEIKRKWFNVILSYWQFIIAPFLSAWLCIPLWFFAWNDTARKKEGNDTEKVSASASAFRRKGLAAIWFWRYVGCCDRGKQTLLTKTVLKERALGNNKLKNHPRSLMIDRVAGFCKCAPFPHISRLCRARALTPSVLRLAHLNSVNPKRADYFMS